MGRFFRDIFSNFFALTFGLLGIASIGFSFVACGISGLFGGSTWIPFFLFFVGGLIFLAIARAFAKRG